MLTQLNFDAKKLKAKPVGDTEKRKLKGSKRDVLQTDSQETVLVEETAKTSASTPIQSAQTHLFLKLKVGTRDASTVLNKAMTYRIRRA